MSKKIYALVFTDSSIPMDFTIFDSFEEALKRFIEYSLHETRKLMLSEDVEEDGEVKSTSNDDTESENDGVEECESENNEDEDEDDELSCTFQVLEKCDPSTEYVLVKEFDMDYFLEDFLAVGQRENLDVFLDDLEKLVTDDNAHLPQEVLDAFTPK